MAGNCRCPKCETLFKVPGQATGNIVQCPACQATLTIAGRKQKRSKSNILADPQLPESRPVSSVTAPRRLKTAGHNLPPELPDRFPARENHVGISTGINDDRIDAIYAFRKKKRLWPAMAAMVLAVGLIGGLFYCVAWIVDQSTQSEMVANANESTTDVSELIPDGSGPMPSLDANTETVSTTKRENAQPSIPRVMQKPEFFSQHDWNQAWQKINGYMVRLVITTPVGTREATGMIVDSRGWVITSLSAIENATTVGVTAAAKRLQDEPQWQPLTDLSRGIIATAPQFDLALIAINRSQVINLTDPNMSTVDSVVSAQRLLIARTPPPDQAAWLSECRVGRRSKLADLNEKQRKVLEKNGLESGEAFRWIVSNLASQGAVSEQVAGSPIVDLDGRVLGFATGFSLDGEMFVVPVGAVLEMLKSIESSPALQPFTGNFAVGRGIDANPGTGGGAVTAEPVDEFAQTAAFVKEGIQACRDTDWSADNVEEFLEFQSLSRGLFELQQLASNSSDAEQEQQREEILQSIFDEIAESLSPDLDLAEFDSGKSNEWFAESISPANPWCILAVTVTKNAITTNAIDGQDATTIRVNGTNEIIVAKLGIDGRVFQSGRKMLIFAKVDVDRPAPRSDGETSGMVRLIEIHAGFWINLRDSE